MALANNPDGGTPLAAEGVKWNDAVAAWEAARVAYGLDAGAANTAISSMENDIWYDWAEGGDHTLDVHLFNFWVTGKSRLVDAAKAAFDAKRVDAPDRNSLNWDEHADALRELDPHFVTVEITEDTDLGGGHGKGTYWKAKGVKSGTEYTGTVPDNEHGRGDGALNGANATVLNVFDLHDTEIDTALNSIAWPA